MFWVLSVSMEVLSDWKEIEHLLNSLSNFVELVSRI